MLEVGVLLVWAVHHMVRPVVLWDKAGVILDELLTLLLIVQHVLVLLIWRGLVEQVAWVPVVGEVPVGVGRNQVFLSDRVGAAVVNDLVSCLVGLAGVWPSLFREFRSGNVLILLLQELFFDVLVGWDVL